ncbi:glycosyltransferase family 2 protein [Georgenia sp. TF02-10]|uniref:glycosyltransferase family 2 protein n=1 Tax=Georgenia sp. TF02-10 TaxID=2917725 RepID=UPI001FA6BFDE|nr:glycosyltransferase family 2 protein [Georgenia sp. TF02-10]UNX55761.1 glycosyltransferase family 2 protein [Georgenia sp. TF02-10]
MSVAAPAPLTLADVLVVVPAWNEEEALPRVLGELAEVLPSAGVVVVSDGSRDRTADVARARGVEVLELPFNLGVGGAMRAGFVYARRRGYRAVVQLDADGQHDPREIGALLACQADTGADLVIGARFAGKGTYTVRGPRRWAMAFLRAVLSRVAGTRLTDATSGFKLVGPRALAVFARDYPAEYLGDTVEAIVLAARHGLRVRQTGVAMRLRAGGTPSQNPVRAALFLGRAVVAVFVALSRPRRDADGGRREVQ